MTTSRPSGDALPNSGPFPGGGAGSCARTGAGWPTGPAIDQHRVHGHRLRGAPGSASHPPTRRIDARRTGRPRAAARRPGERDELVVLGRPDLAAASRAGTANQAVGSIWVAWARSASSRTAKYSAHWTRVVTRSPGSGRSGRQFSSHSAYGDSSPCSSIASCSACMRGPGEAVVVVELQRLPRLARVRVALGVAGRLEGRHRHLVAHDVVGVRVAAVLVVGGHTCGRNSRITATSGAVASSQSTEREAALGQRRLRVALGQPGVDEAEPALLDAEDLGGAGHLLAADLGDVRRAPRAGPSRG